MYQGRTISHFDHRTNSIRVNPQNPHNPYLSEEVSESQHADPGFSPSFVHWIPADEVGQKFPEERKWIVAYRRLARTTDVRTMMAAIGPYAAYEVNANNVYFASEVDASSHCCFVANLNSLPLDYVLRQKLQGTTLNWYIIEQLPVIAPDGYDRTFGHTTARDLVRDHVLRLTYTAHDMEPFARDLGYDGPPFIWNDEERRHLRARLDALYFHLYGLSKDDAAYILDTFPIVRRHDEAAFGRYRTKELVLAYYNALAAGDTDVDVAA